MIWERLFQRLFKLMFLTLIINCQLQCTRNIDDLKKKQVSKNLPLDSLFHEIYRDDNNDNIKNNFKPRYYEQNCAILSKKFGYVNEFQIELILKDIEGFRIG